LPLWAEVDYVAGTVNGVAAVWTKAGEFDWIAVVAPSGDGMYYIDIEAHDILGRTTPLRTTIYYSSGLHWKTDWKPTDNYARQGVTDFARLWYNYGVLRDDLNAEFAFNVRFTAPVFDGYTTKPREEMPNAVEHALKELHVLPILWVEKEVVWTTGGYAPTSDDINRWELNGRELELAMRRMRASWFYSGELLAESGAILF
jgi:hypothetical protein